MAKEPEIINGVVCSVQVVPAADGRFFAHVQCGTTLKVTHDTYKQPSQAEQAGRQLLADTLAQREDEINA